MFWIKYGKKQHNVARGSKSLRLGTLRGYSDGSDLHLQKDPLEGTGKVTNLGQSVTLSARQLEVLSGGAMSGASISIEAGGTVEFNHVAPNCYIFCVALDPAHCIEHAQRIDPDYDDWYALTNAQLFFYGVAQLLRQQLKPGDLVLPSDVSIEYLRGLQVAGWHGEVQYGPRTRVFAGTDSLEAAVLSVEYRELIFRKEANYDELPEYRFAFFVLDQFGQIVPVATACKDLSLQVDLGAAVARA